MNPVIFLPIEILNCMNKILSGKKEKAEGA
jgi:hypothetical protein